MDENIEKNGLADDSVTEETTDTETYTKTETEEALETDGVFDSVETPASDSETDGEPQNAAEADKELQEETEPFEYGLFGEEIGEIQEDSAAPAQAAKKKKLLMAPIVVSLVIVIITAVAALAVSVLFNQGIEGSWYFSETYTPQTYANSTEDEPAETMTLERYFIFESGNKLVIKSGNETSEGTYSSSVDENGKSTVTLNVVDPLYNELISGSFYSEIQGNIFTGKKLKLTSTQNEQAVLEMEAKDHKTPELKREGEFKGDDKLTGKWVNTMDGLGAKYTIVYEFNPDGTFKISNITTMADMTGSGDSTDYLVEFDGIYTCDKNTVTLKYFVVTDQTQEIKYEVKDDILTVKGVSELTFYKVGTPSGDELMPKSK